MSDRFFSRTKKTPFFRGKISFFDKGHPSFVSPSLISLASTPLHCAYFSLKKFFLCLNLASLISWTLKRTPHQLTYVCMTPKVIFKALTLGEEEKYLMIGVQKSQGEEMVYYGFFLAAELTAVFDSFNNIYINRFRNSSSPRLLLEREFFFQGLQSAQSFAMTVMIQILNFWSTFEIIYHYSREMAGGSFLRFFKGVCMFILECRACLRCSWEIHL